jgi:putative flippase GtrA
MSIKNLPENPSYGAWIQFLKYCLLGTFAFFLETGLLYAITESGVHYLVSSGIAFVIVVFIHLCISKKYIFTKCRMSLWAEVTSYLGITLIGLALTELFMYIFTGIMGIYYIFSKAITTIIVLLWNFSSRKLWLYKL